MIIAANEDQLSAIVSLSEFLENIRDILVLPDGKEATIVKGHKLKPRFITFVDRNLEEVKLILEKMP